MSLSHTSFSCVRESALASAYFYWHQPSTMTPNWPQSTVCTGDPLQSQGVPADTWVWCTSAARDHPHASTHDPAQFKAELELLYQGKKVSQHRYQSFRQPLHPDPAARSGVGCCPDTGMVAGTKDGSHLPAAATSLSTSLWH